MTELKTPEEQELDGIRQRVEFWGDGVNPSKDSWYRANAIARDRKRLWNEVERLQAQVGEFAASDVGVLMAQVVELRGDLARRVEAYDGLYVDWQQAATDREAFRGERDEVLEQRDLLYTNAARLAAEVADLIILVKVLGAPGERAFVSFRAFFTALPTEEFQACRRAEKLVYPPELYPPVNQKEKS